MPVAYKTNQRRLTQPCILCTRGEVDTIFARSKHRRRARANTEKLGRNRASRRRGRPRILSILGTWEGLTGRRLVRGELGAGRRRWAAKWLRALRLLAVLLISLRDIPPTENKSRPWRGIPHLRVPGQSGEYQGYPGPAKSWLFDGAP